MTKKATRDKLEHVPMNLIGPNPHRDLSRYPPEPDRVKAIRDSIEDVGWFPGNIVVRRTSAEDELRTGFQYQQAYGHRRIQAARESFKNPEHKLLVVVRNLSDEEMLKYMVRENIADNTGRDFLMLLETWEATLRFLSSDTRQATSIEVASFMGWDRPTKSNGRMLLTNSAYGCNAAHELIGRDILSRGLFVGLTLAQSIKLARETHGKLRAIENKQRALPEHEVKIHTEALKEHARMAAARMREANEAKAEGDEATRALKLAARGPTPLPNARRAIEQARAVVQSWDISQRVEAFCSVVNDLDKHGREQLTWLRQDLIKAVVRLEYDLRALNTSLEDAHSAAVDTVGREVPLLTGDVT